MNNKFPKGSEWLKWDMHVHTPESILSNNFGDDWDEYVRRLFKKAISEEISAIGITDYYSIDGYKKLKNEYLNNDSKMETLFSSDEIIYIRNIFIFPNIEFRINKLVIGKEKDLKWNRKVNYHILFSDKVSPVDIEENFINQLQFEDYGIGDGSPQKNNLTKLNLINLGARLKEEQPDFEKYSDLHVGALNASVDDNQLVQILTSQNSKFKGKYLLALPADEDLSIVSWSSQGHLSRKVLLQKSHIIFSSNKGTIEFCLGKKHSDPDEFINEFNGLKPCLWGSDAHDFEKLFIPDNSKHTWIKSNPTFEGLKQVVYEPEERVKIQEVKPHEKTPYLVIDKVRFIEKSKSKNFKESWIEFNPNLNSIIGGKSSGKSLLLYHIAKTIDPIQVEEKTSLVQGSNYLSFKKEKPFDFEVLWKNGDKDKLSEQEKNGSQITFVPQLYINHLAEDNGEDQLTELIESILKQNENYKEFIEAKNLEIQKCKTNISSSIDDRLVQLNSYRNLISERNQVGNLEKVTAEIKRLKEEIAKLRKESGFSEEQNVSYKKLSQSIDSILKSQETYEKTIDSINNYKLYLEEQFIQIEKHTNLKILDFKSSPFEDLLLTEINKDVLSNIKLSKAKLGVSLVELTEKIKKKGKGNEMRINVLKEEIKPFQAKIKNRTHLTKLETQLKEQNNKLIVIIKFNKDISGIIEKGKQARTDVFAQYKLMHDCYKSINEELQKPEFNKIDSEIELQCKLVFDNNKFQQFTSLFDNRTRLNNVFLRIFKDDNSFVYEEASHIDAISKVFDGLKVGGDSPLKLKSRVEIKDLYYKLLDDYFKLDYEIKYKGDNILQMSPGKRGLVLLQIILHISNASHPILIDQPEDNLDNRTIYDELKQFVKLKKVNRQIVIVSHNANLVVSTDSENIIVANQSGQQIGKDNCEYKFEYVSGALENTYKKINAKGILYKSGIKEHVCDILEGGQSAFQKREQKYGFK